MSPARIVAITLTFLIFLAAAGVAFYLVFDSVSLAIIPAIIIAAAVAAAVYFSTSRNKTTP